MRRRDRQHVALLRFVGPDLHGRHAWLFRRYRAQIEARARAAAIGQFRQRVGDAAGAHVVDGEDGIRIAQRPAAIDHLLATALHFRIGPLHGGEIELFGVGATGHARRGPASQSDQHAGATQLNHQRAGRQWLLVRMPRADVAQPAGQHDGLVVAAHLTAGHFLKRTEIAAEVGSAEFIVERRTADGAFDHDLQRAADTSGLAIHAIDSIGPAIGFPRLAEAGDVQIGHGESGQARLGLRPPARGALVANLSAGARGRPRMRSNRRRVIVGFHLHQRVREFAGETVLAAARIETRRVDPFHDGRIVGVRHHGALRRDLMGVADHGEQ